MTITCMVCDKSQTFNTKNEEKFGQMCAKAGWTVGLPHNKAWCPTCSKVAMLRPRSLSA